MEALSIDKPPYKDLVSKPIPPPDSERQACTSIKAGFHIRHPPSPHKLAPFITPDESLFQTIHMGAATVDPQKWTLVIDGLVSQPIILNLHQLKQLPAATVTSFHECYGSPLKPPTSAVWRIGNVRWTGVRLRTLLALAQPHPDAAYMWSDGLDYGAFAGKTMDRYQKDLPLAKAWQPEVLLAYEMNGAPLDRERGGPVRLVVPGWFGTNSTKWVCRLSMQRTRSASPFTTTWYNEIDPTDPAGERMRPVWMVEPNSIIVQPGPEAELQAADVLVRGWAWSNEGIQDVKVSADNGESWADAHVDSRTEFEWQAYEATVRLSKGHHVLMARATSKSGISQPLQGRRNHVHSVAVDAV